MTASPKIAVYTAQFGGYTELKEPKSVSGAVAMIAFTDGPAVASQWRIEPCRGLFKSPRMSAKWYRMNSDLVLPQYDTTIWVDASFRLGDVDAFAAFCLAAMAGHETAFFRHPERSSVTAEAKASFSVWSEKYKGQPLLDQVASYTSRGMPDDYGLWAGGIQVRDNRSEWVKELNRRWFAECVQWSEQDQLSLPFVLWSLGRLPAVIPGNVYRGPNHTWVRGKDT